jgi:hypothetical protein
MTKKTEHEHQVHKSSRIKPSIQAALDETHPTGGAEVLHHHPSVAGSHRRPGDFDVFDPQDPGMQGIPLAGPPSYLSPSTGDLQRKLAEAPPLLMPDLEHVAAFGEGFTHIASGNEGVTATNIHPNQVRFMDFGAALLLLEQGHRIQRKAWSGRWVEARFPDGAPACLYMTLANGEMTIWTISQADVLARDWSIAP